MDSVLLERIAMALMKGGFHERVTIPFDANYRWFWGLLLINFTNRCSFINISVLGMPVVPMKFI